MKKVRTRRGQGRGKFTIQRGLNDEYPEVFELSFSSLGPALKRVAHFRMIAPRAEFRIVREDSWDGRKWRIMYDGEGKKIK